VTDLRQEMLDELSSGATTPRPPSSTKSKPSTDSRGIFTTHGPARSNPPPEHQVHLLRDRKLEPRTVKLHVAAFRFFFTRYHRVQMTGFRPRRTPYRTFAS
jgi:hypothetical protein